MTYIIAPMRPSIAVDHTIDSFLMHWLVLEKDCPIDVVWQHNAPIAARLVKAPYYEDGEAVIYDHNTLVQFLQERFPGTQLLPADPIHKAQIRQACSMVRENSLDMATELEEILSTGSPWAAGKEFSLLDIYIGTWLSEYVLKYEVSALVAQYWKRISSRPAFRIVDS